MSQTEKAIFSPFIKQCFVTATVCMNVLSNGCAYGFPAVLLPQLKAADSLIPVTKAQESWIASVVTFAMLVGNFTMPPVIDRLGRKKAHFMVMIPTAIGWFLIISATSVQSFILARIMQGLSLGQVVLIRAVIIGEYTSPRNRGAFLTMISVAQTSGVFFVHLIGSWVSWQKTASICVALTILSFLMTFLLPESPSWLAHRGRYAECKKHFEWLRGNGENEELNELIQARMRHNEERTVVGRKAMKTLDFYKPIIICLHISLIMYFSGTMTIAVYGTTIVSEVMGPTVDANFWLLCVDIVRIVTSFLAVYFIRHFKRRTVMFVSAGLCLAVHVAIITYLCVTKYGVMLPFVWIPAVLLNLQFFALSLGILPLNSVIVGEIFPLENRSIAISITTAICTGFHFVVLKTFPYLISLVGIDGLYGLYGSIICYALTVIWFLMPETKGRTLQQIEDRFKDDKKSIPELQSLNNNTKV